MNNFRTKFYTGVFLRGLETTAAVAVWSAVCPCSMDILCSSFPPPHQACARSSTVLHSYGMLLPCDIDKFHGTEYVCCPSSRAGESPKPSLPSHEDDDEEEEIEDEEIDVIDETDLEDEDAVEDRWAVCGSATDQRHSLEILRAWYSDITGHLEELKCGDIDLRQLLWLCW